MKITEMIISAILKKGLYVDLKNVDLTVDLPDTNQKAHIKIEQMTVTVMQDEEQGEAL